jgi:hypothetical protein
MLSMNYPQRLAKCFLVNAPGWWALAWKLISPLIPAKVRAQMALYSKNVGDAAPEPGCRCFPRTRGLPLKADERPIA